MNNLRQLLCLGVLLLLTVSGLPANTPNQPPKGLSHSEWSGLRAAHDAARHRIIAGEGGHQARNPGQQWRTRFDGQGFLVQPDGADWQWGFELVAYGFPGHEHTLPTGSSATQADADGTRLAYAWDAGLSEWFVNDARGLEHGFTVHERPDVREVLDCGSPLSLSGGRTLAEPKHQRTGVVQDAAATTTSLNFHLAVRGGLCPVVEQDGRGMRFMDAHGAARITYAGLKVWDADGQRLPARFEPLDAGHPNEITLAVDERGARYPLTIDPIAQQAYLKASNAEAVDLFGRSVAVSGDTVVVGAYNEGSSAMGVNGIQSDNGADRAGAAYVFVRSGATWIQQAYLKASNTGAGDAFGTSVAISGDTLVVGAHNESSNAKGVNGNQADNSAERTGAAYVFVRNETTWTQQAYLKASNTRYGEQFGWSVAISEDTVIVGAPREGSTSRGVNGNQTHIDLSTIYSGAGYVFVRSGTSWTQQAYLKASNTGYANRFGWSVAVSGNTVVVGAPGESSDATGVNGSQAQLEVGFVADSGTIGAAYVFVRTEAAWTQQAYLKSSYSGGWFYFGASVSVDGDMVVVGATGEDSNATGVNGNQTDRSSENAGAAYLFVRRETLWKQKAYLKASNTKKGQYFGQSLAVSGRTVVVGALFEDSNAVGVNGHQLDFSAEQSGSAYIIGIGYPEIEVERAAFAGLADASSNTRFGAVPVGGGTDLIFTVRNSGTTNLTDLAVTLDGPNANQFSVTANPAPFVASGDSTTFTVRFLPTSDGTKTATLHLASNDPDHNPFDLTLIGTPNVATIAASGNDLTVSFVGEPGNRYRVQYTLDARASALWNEFAPPALYTVPADGVFHHTEVNPPDTLRLYRAVPQP